MSTHHDSERSTDEAVSSSTEAGDNAAILRALATSVALLPQVPQPEGQEPPEGAIALPVIEQDPRDRKHQRIAEALREPHPASG